MTYRTPILSIAIVTVASLGFAPVALAKHRHHHATAKKAALIPAHQKPGYVGAPVGIPGLIDLGYGPVFPFSGK